MPGFGQRHRDLRDRAGLILRTLAATGADGPSDRVFVLGGPQEHRVNLPAQQHRALNLAWALKERDRLGPAGSNLGARVIVVGAGVAGSTFAAAAVSEGARVLLVDEHEEPVTVQRSATQRFLHPCLFDWPAKGWESTTADIPLLNWTAASSADVRNQLVAGLVTAVSHQDDQPLTWLPQCFALTIDPNRLRGVTVDLVAIDDLQAGDISLGGLPSYRVSADLVVTASGFTPERRIPAAVSGSYWKDDRLAELQKDILIVGDGDGALTELFRVALKGAQDDTLWHQQLLPNIVRFATRSLKAKVRDIDGRIRNDARAGSLDELSDGVPVLAGVDGAIKLRDDRDVTLVANPPLLRSNSFLINRFIAARIKAKGGRVILKPDRVESTDVPVLAETLDVIWRTGPPAGERLAEPFFSLDALVQAIGQSALQSRRAGLAADVLDETRTPWWAHLNPAHVTGGYDVVRQLDWLRQDLPSRSGQPHFAPGQAGLVPPVIGAFPVSFETGEVGRSLPDHIRRIVETARRLYALAARMNKPFWWFELTDAGAWISLDLLAIACDIPPFRVAVAIATNHGEGVELEAITPDIADKPRMWVKVNEPADLGAQSPTDIADSAALMKTPPTWNDFFEVDVEQDDEAGPILQASPGFVAASRELEMDADALIKQFGLMTAAQLGEGFTRSWPPPRDFLVHLMAALTGRRVMQLRARPRTDERLGAVAVDLFTRAIASRDGHLARPALLLFGQFVGESPESAPVVEWALQTLTPDLKEADSALLGRSIMVTSFAELTSLDVLDDQSPRLDLASLSDADIREMLNLAERSGFGTEIVRAGSEVLAADAREDVSRLIGGALAEAVEIVDLSYAGVVVNPVVRS